MDEHPAKRAGVDKANQGTARSRPAGHVDNPMAGGMQIGERPVDDVLLYSANGASQLVRLMERSVVGTNLAAATFYCLSERIVGVLGQDVAKTVRIADFPSEDRLLFLLKT